MFGNVQTDDRTFDLDHCGQGHVWIEVDLTSFDEEEDDEEDEPSQIHHRSFRTNPRPPPSQDKTTVHEFSVMVYYTTAFKLAEPDVHDFVDFALVITNEGYKNSKVPLTVKLHCIEEAPSVSDSNFTLANLLSFQKIKGGDVSAIRQSADTAVLLTVGGGGRVTDINVIVSGNTLAVASRKHVRNLFTFGHELAHLVGCYHNRESSSKQNPHFPNAHGYWIGPQSNNPYGGYRSIMAYRRDGNHQRVNYYSSPDLIFPQTGTPTGTDSNNNAEVLIRNREALADIGDESDDSCKKGNEWNGQCVADSNTRLLGDHSEWNLANSPINCIQMCKSHGFKYAGVQLAFQCFCGNTQPPKDKEVPANECWKPCPGDWFKTCGGYWRMNVFTTN